MAQSPTNSCWGAESDSMDESQPEEILLDENAEAARFDFYMVGGLEPSPNHKLLAYAEDTSGNEKYTLHVKDIELDREMLKEPIKVNLKLSKHAQLASCMSCDCCNASLMVMCEYQCGCGCRIGFVLLLRPTFLLGMRQCQM